MKIRNSYVQLFKIVFILSENFMKSIFSVSIYYLTSTGILFSLCSCWAVAAGAGAETGYVVAQEDRTAGQTIDDQMITASIKSKLLADPDVSGLKINVDTFKGNVILRGYVSSQNEINKAVALSQSVSGVSSVTSKMVVG